jgi:hypothetical protein
MKQRGHVQGEAQCKTLVGARCKHAGMCNWIFPGTKSILRLPAAKYDDSFHNRKLRIAA